MTQYPGMIEIPAPAAAEKDDAVSALAREMLACVSDADDFEVPKKSTDLWQGLITQGQPCVIAGDSGSGKTTLIGGLVHAMRTGQPYLGRGVVKGSVLYVAAEDVTGVKLRLRAFDEDVGGGRVAKAHVYSFHADFSEGDTAAALIEAIQQLNADPSNGHPIRLVVFDTLSKVLGDLDENASSDMNRLFNAWERIGRETGAACLGIHHTPLGTSGRVRGSSAIKAASHSLLLVKGSGETERTLYLDKKKDAADRKDVATFGFEVVDFGEREAPDDACVGWANERNTTAIISEVRSDDSKERPRAELLSGQQSDFMQRIIEVIHVRGGKTTAEDCTPGLPYAPMEDAKHAVITSLMKRDGRTPTQAAAAWRDCRRKLKDRNIIGENDSKIWIISREFTDDDG